MYNESEREDSQVRRYNDWHFYALSYRAVGAAIAAASAVDTADQGAPHGRGDE